jgi:hypothetical protein
LLDRIRRGDHNELQSWGVDAGSLFLAAADLAGSIDLRNSTGRQEQKRDLKNVMRWHGLAFFGGMANV